MEVVTNTVSPWAIPIVLGVTGHRQLDPEDAVRAREHVAGLFVTLKRTFASSPLILLSPLAEGADQLVAEIARQSDVPVVAVLPEPVEQYTAAFSEAGRELFARLSAGAAVFVVPKRPWEAVDSVNEREVGFARVGAFLARHCHLLIALWDGNEAHGVGGTGEVVHRRLFGTPDRIGLPESALCFADVGPVWHLQVRNGRDSATGGRAPSSGPILRGPYAGAGPVSGALDFGPELARLNSFNQELLARKGALVAWPPVEVRRQLPAGLQKALLAARTGPQGR